jgi:3-deoxy-D-arabino-heptulosonate 7-phosphate (DAHP) synthase class II
MTVNDELHGFQNSSWAVSTYFPSILLAILRKVLWRTDPLLGNNRKTNNQTKAVAREQILNKQAYAAITE